MNINKSRMGLNRKIMPKQSIESFFKLSNSMGINKVELRNDLRDDSSTEAIIDNLSTDEINQLRDKYNIDVITINAIQFFNNPTKVKDNLKQLEELCKISNEIGNESIIFVPEVNREDTRSEAEKLSDGSSALKEYAEILDKYNITGLVEPLGFEASTLRYPWQAAQIIEDANVSSSFKITIDTFHFYLAHLTEVEFKEKMDIEQVGLVHLSGVEPINELRELTDNDRVLVTDNDIMQNLEQIELFEKMGYKGDYSFEPFAPEFGLNSDEEIELLLEKTLSIINQ